MLAGGFFWPFGHSDEARKWIKNGKEIAKNDRTY